MGAVPPRTPVPWKPRRISRAVLAEAAERVRGAVRSADVACRVGGDEFAIVMPESALHDADQLYRRIDAAVSARPIGKVGKLHLSAGVAALRSEDDSRSFFERADATLYRAKHSGKGRVLSAAQLDEPPRVIRRPDALSD